MFNPITNDFDSFSSAQNPEEFLIKQPIRFISNKHSIEKKLNYIEYLLDPNINIVDLIQLRNALSHYVTLITARDDLHHLALEKFTRKIFLHIFKTHSLSEINNIQENLSRYFPFYAGNATKPAWLTQYIERANMPDLFNKLFKKASYHIKISQFAKNLSSLRYLSIAHVINKINEMAEHTFYTTHTTRTFNAVNTVSQHTGYFMRQIPGLSMISSAAETIANDVFNASLEINTDRRATLKGYAAAMNHILAENLSDFTEQAKKAHIELLFLFYMGGNESFRNDIAFRINYFIFNQRSNRAFLASVLKTIAPEPLGLGWYGFSSHPDILKELSVDCNHILLETVTDLCSDSERAEYQTIIGKIISNDISGYIAFTLNEHTSPGAEWLIYLLSMGHFRADFQVEITYQTLTHRQKVFILALMESTRLVLESNRPINEAVLASFDPHCYFRINHEDSIDIASQMTKDAFRRGVKRLAIQHVYPTNLMLQNILTNTTPFINVDPDCYVIHSIVDNHGAEIMLGFQLFGISAFRCISLNDSQATREKLRQATIQVFLDAFSRDWEKAITTIPVYNSNLPGHYLLRPIAIPESALLRNDIRNAITMNRNDLQLLVYKEINGKKVFQYDIDVKSKIYLGEFSTIAESTKQLEINAAQAAFPELELRTSSGQYFSTRSVHTDSPSNESSATSSLSVKSTTRGTL